LRQTNYSGPSRDRNSLHLIDVHVGARLRLRRSMLGLTQGKLGEALGVTFQQIQKYERGANRIGASRLLEVARILDVPVRFFFDDADPVRAPAMPRFDEVAEAQRESDPMCAAETVELVAAYYSIIDPEHRHALVEIARSLSVMVDDGRTGASHRRLQHATRRADRSQTE
jgi:transcriptional regulator with XRE-family HTH domain